MDVEGSTGPAETERVAVSKTYAIADLHGRHDLLIAAINAVADIDSGPLSLVFLDGGSDREMAEPKIAYTLAKLMSEPPDDWCVYGVGVSGIEGRRWHKWERFLTSFASDRVVIGVFEDDGYGLPVDLIEVKGAGEWSRIERQMKDVAHE